MVCLATGALLSPVFASETEEVFRAAIAYTVKIRTRITINFVEDDYGSFEGAGFVVDAERKWILTNAHVVGRSPATITVAFKDKPFISARKIYVDPYRDVAVLEIDDASDQSILAAAPLNCVGMPNVGHSIGAFGHPYSLDYTGTRGIVSGVTKITSMLQIDAAINPGNSGGPLISLLSGRVVGINTASLVADDAEVQNTNFAEPIVYACKILDLLREGKDPSPPVMPIVYYVPPVDRDALIVARSYLQQDRIDLRSGDEIVGVEGSSEQVRNEAQLVHLLRGSLKSVGLSVKRGTEEMIVSGYLKPHARITDRRGILMSGLLIAPGDIYRDDRQVRDSDLLVIHSVKPGSIGDESLFYSYDVVVSIDGRLHGDLDTTLEYLKTSQEAARSIEVEVMRVSVNDQSAPGGPTMMEYMKQQIKVDGLEIVESR